jgi:hypothetical protein
MKTDEIVAFYRANVPGSRVFLVVQSPDGGIHVEGLSRTDTHSGSVSYGASTSVALRISEILDRELPR